MHVSFDCVGDYLVSASTDGSVFFWDLVSSPPNLTKQLPALVDKHLQTKWSVSWNSEKGSLAFPGKNKQIVVMEKDTWQVLYNIKHEALNVIINTTNFYSRMLNALHGHLMGRYSLHWILKSKYSFGSHPYQELKSFQSKSNRQLLFIFWQNCPTTFTSFDWIDEKRMVAVN